MDLVDLYVRKPSQRATKSEPTPWEGKEGDEARSLGVRTKEEFAVFKVIEVVHRDNEHSGAYLTNAEIARRLKASTDGVNKVVQALVLRGVIRAEAGLFGVRRLRPVNGD
jgi:hypothetical protein